MSVYNGAQYLKSSIGSMLSQTSDYWKLICIDDGSTDNSLPVLREYEKQDTRITVLHQENRGLSVARALAFAHADTEYVCILDCDDALQTDYIEKMLAKAEATNADAILSDVEYGYDNTPKAPNHFVQYNLNEEFKIADGTDALRLTVPWRIHGWFCIKREIIQKYYTLEQASASPCKTYYDEFLARLMYYHCQTFALCNACYRYRMAEGSITRSVSLKKIDLLESLDYLLALCNKENLPSDILLNVYNEYYCQIVNLWKFSSRLPSNDIENGRQKIKSYYSSFRRNVCPNVINKASFKTKMKLRVAVSNFAYIKLLAKL